MVLIASIVIAILLAFSACIRSWAGWLLWAMHPHDSPACATRTSAIRHPNCPRHLALLALCPSQPRRTYLLLQRHSLWDLPSKAGFSLYAIRLLSFPKGISFP